MLTYIVNVMSIPVLWRTWLFIQLEYTECTNQKITLVHEPGSLITLFMGSVLETCDSQNTTTHLTFNCHNWSSEIKCCGMVRWTKLLPQPPMVILNGTALSFDCQYQHSRIKHNSLLYFKKTATTTTTTTTKIIIKKKTFHYIWE